MINSFQINSNKFTVPDRIRKIRLAQLFWLVIILNLAGLFSMLMVRDGPNPAYIAWIIYLTGAALIVYQPRIGLYLILFFSLIGDNVMLPWYPFNKGFSSYESLFYLSRLLIFSPLEIYILLTIASWLLRGLMLRNFKIKTGGLFKIAVVFLCFVTAGLIYGLATRGNFNIALWQVRPLFYMVMMIFLASNLLENRAQISNLMWWAMLGLFIKAIVGNINYFIVLMGSLNVASMTEHATPIQLNTIFIFAIAVWLYKSSWPKKLFLPLMIPIVLITWLASQRRAAMIALIIGLALFAIIMFREHRRLFWLIIPPIVCLFAIYVLAFWNSSSTQALPAQAIKSVISPGSVSARDRSSDIYRYIENFDLWFTMRQKPFTGIGFGQPFYLPIPLPDISWFVWWQYYPHNSIIWIWLTTGVGGFMTMLVLLGSAIIKGLKVFLDLPSSELKAVALTATLYIVMHFIFAYVDISWDIQSMLYIGTMIGLIDCLESVAATPLEIKYSRYQWQSTSRPAAELVPLSEE